MSSVNDKIGWGLQNNSSSDSANECSKKIPESKTREKISTEETVRKSRPNSSLKETVRDSSLSSVSSQSGATSRKTRRKRKKKSKSSETSRDSSVASVSSQTSTSSRKKKEKKSAETARDSSVASVSGQTSSSSQKKKEEKKSAETTRDSSVASVSRQTVASSQKKKEEKKSAETARDSSVASVSSQTSTSSKKKQENETARDSSVTSVSSHASTSSKQKSETKKSAETVRDSSVTSVSNRTSTSSKQKSETKKSAVEKKLPTKTDDLEIAKQLMCINFPLEANYDFRLVCSRCLVKEKEGPNAFRLKDVCPQCGRNQLAIKRKSQNNWLLVRNRPAFDGVYKICLDFQCSTPCKMNPCTFAHGEGESIMWTHEQKTMFRLDMFIEELRKNNIVTSQRLAEVKSNTYIPGLSTTKSLISSERRLPDTIPNMTKSATESTPAMIPGQNGYTKIDIIKSKPITQPSLRPVPTKNLTNFPILHEQFNANSIGTLPQLYTMNNPDLTSIKNGQSYTDTVIAPPKKAPSDPSLKPVSVESWPFTKDENPLEETHDVQMFCSECFPRNFQKAKPHANCLKNILAFAEKGTHNWLQVRERKKIQFFAGSYVLCKSLFGDPSLCKFGSENCSFAHNTIEMLLWNADKHEIFDLTGFIYSQSTDEYRISHFTRKYGTDFSYICGACFKSSNLISNESKKRNVCDGLQAHDWNSNKMLFYAPERKLINKLLNTTYLFKVCSDKKCRQTCSMAHSIVEREVWMLLRGIGITEEKFVEVLDRYSDFFMMQRNSQSDAVRTPCPYKLILLCRKCSSNGRNVTHKQCGHSEISSGVIYMTNPGFKQVNKLPHVIPKNYRFIICKSFKNNKCTFQGECTFAHSQEEIDVWQWMCFNRIKSLEEIFSYQEKRSTEVVKGAASIVQDLLHPAVEELPVPHYCQFCGISCRNQMEWENHCTTNEHNKNVSHDQEQQWNYREPPWNYRNEKNLKLCEKHERQQCLYSSSLDMHNLCPYAHGINEFEEWKKRFEWRALKMDLAKKPHIMSYIVQLQETCLNSREPFYVMSENILDVQLEMNGDEKVFSTEKKFSYAWTITVTSQQRKLQKISLLHDKDRLYFTLMMDCDENNFQVLDGHHCKQQGEFNRWKVTVNYNGNMYGSFSQRVIFDFGEKPLLFRDLAVDVGTYEELQQLVTIREENNFELWTPENREIVFLPRTKNLINKYKRPSNIADILNHDVISTELNRHNYLQKMHKLLFLEEFACHQKMSRYNLCTDMIVSKTIGDGTTLLNSEPGKLFGEFPLSDELSEDTDIGRLILTSCTSVYIALPMFSSKVYEVEIVSDNHNFKGQQRTSIYLLLTKSFIQDLGLTPNVYPDVELQFQLNRHSFFLMHFALDNLDSIDIVFPDPVKNIFSQKTKPTKCSSKILNKEQLIAVKYIVSQRENFLCPFILNGAYGTGKTETLAQATMQLLDTQPNAKILICTQCNSSADLFILKHLDEYVKKQQNQKMLLRVYYSGRHVVSVPYEVRKYTLMSSTQDQFRNAEKTDFVHVRVVICTLENCHKLIKLQLKGMFTHIFIDEAAQELEAKVLLPLSLATKDTCVVLSGDYHQMGVKVHSTVARQQGLGVSIMQRLFKHYANHPHQNVNADSPLHTLLVHNYRSVKAINQFISTCFYGIATNQQELKTLPSISRLKPLQFYAVSGIESHYHSSPSYFNEKEIIQIVDCVVNMSSNWPKELGSFNPKSICIVSSYKDQVNLIRLSLRKHGMRLSQVVVEQVGNIPGKEFDVIIISTVRTSKRLDINPEELANYCNETDEVDFFNNKKLLNTAMTRAKHSIIVVGDPVALCAYGKCSTIWRIFINYCSKLCSVKPPEITYDVVRLEVSRLLSDRKTSIHAWRNSNDFYQRSVSPNLIDQVPKPDTCSVNPVSKTESSNYVNPNPIDQVPKPDTCSVNPVSKTESSNYVNPNPIRQVPTEDSLFNPKPDTCSVNPVSKTESSNYVNPNPIRQVPTEDSLFNPKPDTKLMNAISKTAKDSSLSKLANPNILQLAWNQPYPLHHPKSRIDLLFSFLEDEYCYESSRINFSFPCVYVIDSPAENLLIGLSFYKVAEHFIVGIHWPDLQSYIPNKKFDDIGALETVLALGPKQSLPNMPELYFTLDHAIGAVSCLLKVNIQGEVLDCSFHQTFIKPEKIIPITELENYLQRTTEKEELNFPNYLHKLANIWCKLRLGNESLYVKNPYTDHPKSEKLLTEICIQVHIQIVRYLSKVFPETTPTVWQSFQKGSRFDQWKREHVSDALNSVLLLQPYLHGKICRCETFCKCLLDYIKQEDLKSTIPKTLEINADTWQLIINSVDENRFEDAQDIILGPFCHNRIAVALKKLSNLTDMEFGYSNNFASDYSLNFDPQVYFCKPSISFLDLLVQEMLVAAIHKLPNPVNVEVVQKVTKKLTETIAAKQLQQKDEFFQKLLKDFPDQTIETQATVISVDNSMVEILLPRIAFSSHSVCLDILGSSSTSSESCTLQFTQIEANVQTCSSICAAETSSKNIESNMATISINVFNWQQILSSLRKQNFSQIKNYVHTAKSAEDKEAKNPNSRISTGNSFCIDVHPYLNFQASVKIVEDSEGHCSPQLQVLHLNPNVSLCLLHRNEPLKYFLPEYSVKLSEHQHRLLTEVYRCAIQQNRSIILRDVTLFPENQFWIFSIPGSILQDHGICLEADNDPDVGFVFPPLQNMICVRFSLMAENLKSTQIFHGYICETHSSGSNVKVIISVTDDEDDKLVKLQHQKCDIEIRTWTSECRSMADAILNLEASNQLAKNILSRQFKPVKYSAEIFSVFEENEFVVIASDNILSNLTHLIHWFEYYASVLRIRKTSAKCPVLICTPTQYQLDIIVDYLQIENLLTQMNVVRVADESRSLCTSAKKIFLHEKLCSFNKQLTEEMNAFAEIYDQSLYGKDFKQQHAIEILSQADVILCTTLTTHRSVFRSISSGIKQMIIFNAHLCREVEAMIPISYLPIERLGLFSSSELAQENSIANRLLRSCPNSKLILKY